MSISPQLEQECKKILTYGICLDAIQTVSNTMKRSNQTTTPRNVNRNYQNFKRAILTRHSK